MKTILFFVFLSGCGLNESLVNSIGEQAKDVIDKAKSQGGQKGIQTLNDEIEDLEEKIDKKENEYRKLKNRIDDKEDELDEKEDELDKKQNELDDVEKRLREIEERLKAGDLTPEEIQALKDERDRLQGEKTTLESEKQQLQDQIAGLNSDKEQLETERDQAKAERDQAKTDLEAVKQARDDLQRQLDKAIKDRDRARRERDNARAGEQTQRDRARTAEEDRACWKRTSFDVCGIKDKIQVAIRQALSNKPCGDTNICDLEGITTLNLTSEPPQERSSRSCAGNLELSPADFKYFIRLDTLDFSGTCLSGFSDYTGREGFFNGLNSLRTIDLQDTGVTILPLNFFDGVLGTLQEIKVDSFVYCRTQPPSYLPQLIAGGSEVHNDGICP